MPTPRDAFAAWKAERGLTDEQIAEEVRKRGLSCSRQMVGALLSGDRCASGPLAIALHDITGLPLPLFITKPAETTEPNAAA